MSREQLYRFGRLDIHSAIIVQQAIETRKVDMTSTEEKSLQTSDKALKAAIETLDQIYDDLDRHIAAAVRLQEYKEQAKRSEAGNGHFPAELGS